LSRPLRLLLFSTLFPSSVQPSHGIFVQTRLRHLLATGEVQAQVVAPVPWFPSTNPRFGEYATYAAVPREETRQGLTVHHPRFIRLPKIGMTTAPYTLARSGLAAARQLQAGGFDFDLIDAHYFYPDGVAAVMIGRALGKPVTITARGTDINLIPQHALPRHLILQAADRCAHMITVCKALKTALVDLGAPADKVTVLRNGVDLTLFRPDDRMAARAKLGMTGFCLASVGHLIERKGHNLVIEALQWLPGVQLHIAGSGPDEAALRALAGALGVKDRVHFLGSLPQEALRGLYNAADALVLASSREGWANVLLEAMACGTPVVASNVWGTPEVVATAEAGQLMSERSATGIAAAVDRLRAALPERSSTRRYAEGFDWQPTTQGQLDIFDRALTSFSGPARH
jgi:teichuronic acid biosynthesis glycosyltransferase TuaC